MKKSLRFAYILSFTLITSLTAYVLTKGLIWREISEAQAKKQALNIPSWWPLIEIAQPAVVLITTEAVVEQPAMEFPGLPAPFRFFMPMPPEKQQGQGSGFIINEEGYLLTNHHVIDGAQKIKVTVGLNPQIYAAKIIGSDKELDIALLQIQTPPEEKVKWPFLPLGSSDALNLGDWVIALGNPLGLHQSVTIGIVSHKHRGGLTPSGKELFAELMQFQLPINPGNSGGPVMDSSGRVVAISESMANAQSISFGLPIDLVKRMLPQLIKTGQIEKAFLGVDPTDLTPQYAKALGLSPNDKGAVIMQVVQNTPAEKAGLKPMDVILEINNQKITDSFNLRQYTAYAGVNTVIELKIHRKNVGIKMIKVTLEKRPGQPAAPAVPEKTLEEKTVEITSIGLKVIDTSTEIQKQLNLPSNNTGAQVVGVLRGSPAAFVRIEPNDVVISVNDVAISSAKDLKNMIDKMPSESAVLIMLRRGNAKIFVPLEKP